LSFFLKSPMAFPQGLKPGSLCAIYGGTEVPPFQNINV
jgi:hypothetical protein